MRYKKESSLVAQLSMSIVVTRRQEEENRRSFVGQRSSLGGNGRRSGWTKSRGRGGLVRTSDSPTSLVMRLYGAQKNALGGGLFIAVAVLLLLTLQKYHRAQRNNLYYTRLSTVLHVFLSPSLSYIFFSPIKKESRALAA